MSPRPPDLRVFLLLLVAGSILILIGRGLMLLGFGSLGLLVGGPGILWIGVLFWCLSFHAAPRFTRQATVVVICSAMFLSLLSLWIGHSRSQARQQQLMNNLRQVGMGLQEHTGFAPPTKPQQPPWTSHLPQFDTESITSQPSTDQVPSP